MRLCLELLMRGVILVVVAHPDDQIFGPGGALARFAKEGKKVKTIIASYGELSHPHFRREIIRQIRIAESDKADEIIGGDGIEYWGAREGKFKEDVQNLKLAAKLKSRILKYKPEKIFTHARNETHPDHVAINNLVLECYDELHSKGQLSCPVYTFTVWNYFRVKKRDVPRLVVDISDSFKIKLKALSVFRSQIIAMVSLKWSVYVKAFFAGLRNNVQFAEVFYKIR